jgi:tetratricopeptide (TPR) repeat protein
VAEYIEGAVQDTAGLSTILAHHWREAGEASRAIEYLMQAAEQALNAWALTEAVSLYDAAIALATDDHERFRIMLARGLARSRLGAYPEAVSDLAELLPHLGGRDRIEALLGYGWALQWTEATDETIAAADEALRLAEAADDRELVPVAKALVSHGLAMRGGPGDLDSAGEIGEEALRLWLPGARPWWHLNHEHLLGEQFYWTGRLADGHALMTSASTSGSDPQSIQARLRHAALKAQILCSLGQYEESIRLFEETTRIAVEAGRPIRVTRNYATQPLRELFDLAEARRWSEECLEGPDEAGGFMMPRANARADLMTAALLEGDLETAETFWRLQWDESTTTARAWTRWLLICRLAAARAQMELMSNRTDQAIEWGRKAIELSKPVRRVKYEIVGRATLGRALGAAGKPHEALTELTLAAAQADSLGTPRLRWEVLAALGRAQYAAGADNAAESAFSSASTVIHDIASGLEPQRAERFLGAEPVREVLKGATKAQL